MSIQRDYTIKNLMIKVDSSLSKQVDSSLSKNQALIS